MSRINNFPAKGEIWLLKNLERIKELGKDYRPVLVISNDEQNEFSNSVVVLPTTTDDLETSYQCKFLLKILLKMV